MAVSLECIEGEKLDNIWEHRIIPTSTIKGKISIRGLVYACQSFDSADQTTFRTPLFDQNRWQFQVQLANHGTRNVGIYLYCRASAEEVFLREGLYTCTLAMKVGESFERHGVIRQRSYQKDSGVGLAAYCTMDDIANTIEEEDLIELRYAIKQYPNNLGTLQAHYLKPSVPTDLLRAYSLLFDDPNTADVQFISFQRPGTHRGHIYAHSTILSYLSEYFKTMFASGFSEGAELEMMTPPSFDDSKSNSNDSDSDYEEEDNNQDHTRIEELNESVIIYQSRNIKNDSPTRVAIENIETASTSTGFPSRYFPGDRRYKVVMIKDAAFRTFRSLLYYLYTGSLRFAPLTSTYNVERANAIAAGRLGQFPTKASYYEQKATVASSNNDKMAVAWTSAKSIYTLCDKIDVPEVKYAAAQHIKKSLTPENILPEIFSNFTSKHDEIYRVELDYLKENWVQIRASPNFKQFIKDLFVFRSQDAHVSKTWLDIVEATS